MLIVHCCVILLRIWRGSQRNSWNVSPLSTLNSTDFQYWNVSIINHNQPTANYSSGFPWACGVTLSRSRLWSAREVIQLLLGVPNRLLMGAAPSNGCHAICCQLRNCDLLKKTHQKPSISKFCMRKGACTCRNHLHYHMILSTCQYLMVKVKTC